MNKILFVMSALLGTVTSAVAAQQYVYANAYWDANTPLESAGKANSGQIDPSMWPLAVGSTKEFIAFPSTGETVDHWRMVQGNNFGFGSGSKVEGSDGKTNLLWTAREANSVSLGVKFRWINYNLAYDLDGGSGAASGTSGISYTSEITLSVAPAKTGYRFQGWRDGAGTIWAAGASVTGASFAELNGLHDDLHTVTNTAVWLVNAYRPTVDLGGGSWMDAGYSPPASVDFDGVFTLPAPVRMGYEFLGWKAGQGLDASVARWGKDGDPSTQFSDQTLCENGDQPVYFRNLSPVNAAVVSLSAQWKAKTIQVKLNNMGATGGKESTTAVYAQGYDFLNIPTKAGGAFKGYRIDGETYWDANGQPTKATWDIPTNCTAVAAWDTINFLLIYDENRGEGSQRTSRSLEYGQEVELYDGADFQNPGCTLLGWSVDSHATAPDSGLGLGAKKSFYEKTTLYAVWEKNYFIAYDGNGATSGEMVVQKFAFGRKNQALDPNGFAKTGYAFLGWALGREQADALLVAYKDKQVLAADMPGSAVGGTNVLYATWGTNAYHVAFLPNGGEGELMPVLDCVYDQPVKLPPCAYANGELLAFAGWSNDVGKVVYSDLSAPVSNLCAEADATNFLYATWKLDIGELSEAMGCDSLIWANEGAGAGWQAGTVVRDGQSVSCALSKVQYALMRSSNVTTNGTLSFAWMTEAAGEGNKLTVILYDANDSWIKDIPLEGGANEWQEANVEIDLAELGKSKVYFQIMQEAGAVSYITDMSWTPSGAEPEQGDPVAATGVSVTDGKFVLSVPGESGVNYGVWTNANLLVPVESWGFMTNHVGEGASFSFELPIAPELPQLFFSTFQVK